MVFHFCWKRLRQQLQLAASLLSCLLLPGIAYTGAFIEEFDAQTYTGSPPVAQSGTPIAITRGPPGDDGIWYSNNFHAIGADFKTAIVHMDKAGNKTVFKIQDFSGQISSMTVGPDNALWFVLEGSQRIGRMTTAGSLSVYPDPATPSLPFTPRAITRGPDNALWFIERTSYLRRIATDGTISAPIPVATGDDPNPDPRSIVAGPDGAMWFVEADSNKTGRITTDGLTVAKYNLPTSNQSPRFITVGGDGALWFNESHGFGRITTAGTITEFHPGVLEPEDGEHLVLGPDGAVWFVNGGTGGLGRITTAGVITKFRLNPAPSYPLDGLTVGPDGALWFTDSEGNKVGRLVPPAPGDTDVDGKSDILLRGSGGNVGVIGMNGMQPKPYRNLGWRSTAEEIVATGDFDGDGDRDILWRLKTDGMVDLWTLKNGQYDATKTVVSSIGAAIHLDTSWLPSGVGDFDGDGKSDVLWRNKDGSLRLWLMDDAKVKVDSACLLLLAASRCMNKSELTNWKVQGLGDFDGDGRSDIVWRDDKGHVSIWFMNGASITKIATVKTSAPLPATQQIIAVADFDNDGFADILLRDNGAGVRLWLMYRNAIRADLSIGLIKKAWAVAATGDYNADGKSDILWYETSTGGVVEWQIGGKGVVARYVQKVPLNLAIQK